eukprot:TRINITY_DN34820_c0_g1_i1.p1 TRINITY_DN34820_c0_g1~~TRINITY_DN34820_c0_g1_i1.p1  ORF type:complete len:489 (-),score=123.08 TRINITY_DN34820_c0_g1_i1:128-1480(-)
MLNLQGIMAPVSQTGATADPKSEEKEVKKANPSMKYGRANSMLVELLGEYKGRPFQDKLKSVLDKATREGREVTDDLPARWELARTVHADILARHGFHDISGESREAVTSVLQAVLADFPKLITKVEDISKALRLKGSIARAEIASDAKKEFALEKKPEVQDFTSEATTTPPSSPCLEPRTFLPHSLKPAPWLTTRRALALQVELLSAYSSPRFQKKLSELAREHKTAEDGLSSEYRAAFKGLVRKEQFDIIPRYGFQMSEGGVEEMLLAYKHFGDDPDVYVNSVAIEEALTRFTAKQQSADLGEKKPEGAVQDPGHYLLASKVAVKDFLSRQLQAFSAPQFQRSITALKMVENSQANGVPGDLKRRCSKDDGYYHLSGRGELALRQQAPILEHFGFEPTSRGLQEAIWKVSKYLDDLEVAELLDGVNAKLGMSPDACIRFRKLARSLLD